MKDEPYDNYCTECKCPLESNVLKCFVCGNKSILAVETYCMTMDLGCDEEAHRNNEQLRKQLGESEVIEDIIFQEMDKLEKEIDKHMIPEKEKPKEMQKSSLRGVIRGSKETTERQGILFRVWYWWVGLKQKIMYYLVKGLFKGIISWLTGGLD